ncbi:hypothetical protein Ciccas_010155 [Cichlidogyrus casuarinus]|uniref:Uncharacterized protein n=1 Tax=Cichlidogyrus casuarinus TaxID=1844966 RepID=A0ABD2PUY6_9PLAT
MSDDENVDGTSNITKVLMQMFHEQDDGKLSKQKKREKLRSIFQTLGKCLQHFVADQAKIAFNQDSESRYRFYQTEINKTYMSLVRVTTMINSKFQHNKQDSDGQRRNTAGPKVAMSSTNLAIKATNDQAKKTNSRSSDSQKSIVRRGKMYRNSVEEEADPDPVAEEMDVDEDNMLREVMKQSKDDADVVEEEIVFGQYEHVFPITCQICNQLKNYNCLKHHYDPTKCIVSRKFYGPCSCGDTIVITEDKGTDSGHSYENNNSDTELTPSKRMDSTVSSKSNIRLTVFRPDLKKDTSKFLNTTRKGLIVHLTALDDSETASKCKKSEHPYR